MARFPQDNRGNIIPVLKYKSPQFILANTAASTVSAAFPFGTQVIQIEATPNAVFFNTGNANVIANSSTHYLGADRERQLNLGGDSYIAFRAVSANSNVYISVLD